MSAPLFAAGAIALFLLGSRPATAQYLGAYKAGLDAIEAKDWDRAADEMRRAIDERSDEKMKLPVRLFLKPYVPHFYLGWARFERGDCAGALASWAESERQGVAPRLPEFAVVRRGRETCLERDRQAALSLARQDVRAELARTESTAAALYDRSLEPSTRDAWQRGAPSPSERHQQALAAIDRVRNLLGSSDVDAGALRRAEALLRDADRTLTGIGADLDRALESTRRELAVRDEGIESRVTEAKALLARTQRLAPFPRQIGKARADLEGLLAESERRGGASKAQLEGLAARLERSIEMLARLTAAPPGALGDAIEAYLAGRHAEVVAELAGAKFAERRARAHAHLLLAASRHELWLEGGELDVELHAAAAEDARAVRDDDESLAPSERYFSPRFVAFFAECLGATAPSS